MRDHRTLRAFVLADELALDVYARTQWFPSHERFGLTSQLRRGAVSVASNIIEGCSRSSRPDYARFLEIAYGAAQELEYQLSLAQRLGYLSVEDQTSIRALAIETCKVIRGLLCSLRRR